MIDTDLKKVGENINTVRKWSLACNRLWRKYPFWCFLSAVMVQTLALFFGFNYIMDSTTNKTDQRIDSLDLIFINQEYEKIIKGNLQDVKETWIKYDLRVCKELQYPLKQAVEEKCSAILKVAIENGWDK